MPRGRPPKPKQVTEPTEAAYLMVGNQMPKGITLLGVPGDMGVLIDSARFVTMVTKDRFDKLVRLYGLTTWQGTRKWECGKCGMIFSEEHHRDNHGRRQHTPPRYTFKDLSELTDEQREIIKAEAGQPGLKRGDPGYDVSPADFHTPDPSDREVNADDRHLRETIEWEKTAANQR